VFKCLRQMQTAFSPQKCLVGVSFRCFRKGAKEGALYPRRVQGGTLWCPLRCRGNMRQNRNERVKPPFRLSANKESWRHLRRE